MEGAANSTPEEFARVLIPDIVDSTISHLLGAIEQNLLHVLFVASNQNSIDLTAAATESGELSGWYKGADGWIEKYSKQRFSDDFADLREFFKNEGTESPE